MNKSDGLADHTKRAEEVLATWNGISLVKELARAVVEMGKVIEKMKVSHLQWMEAGAKGGYVFGVGKESFTVEHNPELAAKLAEINESDRIRELEAERDELKYRLQTWADVHDEQARDASAKRNEPDAP